MNTFEHFLDKSADICGWNEESKNAILIEFLENNCVEQLAEFALYVSDKVNEELDNSEE